MSLTPVFIDYETYWDKDYSLKKLTPIEYVMGDQYETQSVAVKVGLDGPTEVHFGRTNIAAAWEMLERTIGWDRIWAIGHNMSEFDALIHAWRFGIQPRMWGCTLAMARPIHTKTTGCSLKALAKAYDLQDKGSLEATNTKGKRLKDFTAEEVAAMRAYNGLDTDLCAELFVRLLKQTPKTELRLIDTTVRMLVGRPFEVDIPLLERGLKAERTRKARALEHLARRLLLDSETLASNARSTAKFATMLRELGAVVPMKPSKTTGKMIPALAKTDEGMTELLEDPNELVRAAAEVRLDAKSTILESRIERFIQAGQLCGGRMPIALRYYGADTTGRWSGNVARLNQQNLPRIDPKQRKLSDVLRFSLRAPAGHKVVVADLSGIELRVNHFLWQVDSSMQAFQQDPTADLYKLFAAEMYGVDPADVSKHQRQLAKVAQLGLGFGAGWKTFQQIARIMGSIQLDEKQACKVVERWRDTYHNIVSGWSACDTALEWMGAEAPRLLPIDPWGHCQTDRQALHSPKGVLRYPDLHQSKQEAQQGRLQWVYSHGRRTVSIWAGKLTENIVQHLARHVMTDVVLDFAKSDLGQQYPLAHTVHDELIYIVRDADAEAVLDALLTRMATPPTWWPELVTAAEGDIAQTYGGAK